MLYKLTILFFAILFCFSDSYCQTSVEEVRPLIKRISRKLSKADAIHLGQPQGIGAEMDTTNRYYKLHTKLKKNATDQELILLSNTESPVLLVYVFLALADKGNYYVKEILKKHISDTRMVLVPSGCMDVSSPVNSFLLSSLRPIESYQYLNYLTKEEYASFEKIINGQAK